MEKTLYDATLKNNFRLPSRPQNSHKGSFGRVLLIAGSKDMGGAALLSALAAYRSGCGLVEVFTHPCNRDVILSRVPEAIVTTCDRADCRRLQTSLKTADVVAIGPGLSTDSTACSITQYVLQNYHEPLVLDADALNLLSEHMDWLENRAGNEKLVITPHPKEMSKLLNCSVSEVLSNAEQMAVALSQKYGIYCVLKLHHTLVTDGKRIYENHSGNSGMATGGSGDVLTGMLAAWMAQGMSVFEAASMAVYLHGKAGDLAAAEVSEYSLMSGDIIRYLPRAIQTLYEKKISERSTF